MVITVDIHFKKLVPSLIEDFFRFFDCDAFSDHTEWAGCYCLESHLTKEEDEGCTDKAERREKAEKLILEGIMTGYLIYDGGKVIGWCNAGDKCDYRPICNEPAFLTDGGKRGHTKVIYCFDVRQDYRGKGIATLALERVLEDAKKEGYAFLEVYPLADREEIYQYKGPLGLYEKYGFEYCRTVGEVYIMRKAL